ncbi:MAG TPA: hypothetical protein VHD56_06600 [Tepidisphaeraceae bacterium]|nr:hypothetical protein [Tepidisphaeraceae bacterium]
MQARCASILFAATALIASNAMAQVSPQAGGLVINEYNATSSAKTLTTDPAKPWKGGDTFFGYQVPGNGGNWVELVVTKDHLNVQGWQLAWSNADLPGTNAGSFSFTDNPIWGDLRAGTIITVREDDTGSPGAYGALPTNTSFKPDTGDWWIHINVDDTNYVSQTGFKTDNDDWTGTIKDAKNRIVFGPAGEAAPNFGGGGVSSTEAVANSADPAYTNTNNDLEDIDYTTFGSPNVTNSHTVTQDFSALRNWWSRTDRIAGDANLDRMVDLSDMIIFAANWQTSGDTWMDGDFNGDGKVDVHDLTLLAHNWQVGVGGVPLAQALQEVGLVPEPAMASFVLMPLVLIRRRKA